MKKMFFIGMVILFCSCNDGGESANLKETSSEKVDTIYGVPDTASAYTISTVPDTSYAGLREMVKNFDPTLFELSESISIASSDVEIATAHIRWAWGNYGPCTRFPLCATYIGNFEIVFSDGNISFRNIVQRLTTSAHDCIANAKNALGRNDRGLAVAWVMASQIHNSPVYDWLKNHGDAVITALRSCC